MGLVSESGLTSVGRMISRHLVSTAAKLSQEVGEAVSRCRDGVKNRRATQPSKRQEAAEGRAARERLSPTHVLSSKHVFSVEAAAACAQETTLNWMVTGVT